MVEDGVRRDVEKLLALKPGETYATSPWRFEQAKRNERVAMMLEEPGVYWSSSGTDKTVTVERRKPR